MKNIFLPSRYNSLLFFCLFFMSGGVWGQVMISQYIETNSGSTPKGVEIFNYGATDIVFSAGNNLQIFQGTNGSSCSALSATNTTTGTLKAGEVWVIGTTDLVNFANDNGTDLSGTTTFAFSFNGDDALQLYLGGVLMDVFGTCGNDPGSSWTGGGVDTRNNNIQTKSGICTGTTSNWTNPSDRFENVANGSTMTGFGNAPSSCSSPTAPTGVTTGTAGSITATSAIISGNDVGGDGGDAITERGVVYGTSANPTTADNKQVESGTTGTFNATLTGLNSSTTYFARAFATNSVGTTYGSDVSFTTNAPAGDTDSDIIENTGFSYNTNINYSTSVNAGPLTTGNSIALAEFTIRDGGAGTDADAFATTLTNLTLSVSNHVNLNRIALFDGSSNVAEVAAGASVDFSGLSLVAADNGSKTFSVRASFNSTVTDNQQIQLSITSATAQAGASLFAVADAGGASSSTAGDNNRIEVTATQLAFVQQPSNADINETMTPAVTVEAIDANNNRDLDYTANINITSTGTLTGTPVSVAAVAGLATFSTLTHTAVGTGLTLSAASGAITGATSGSFDVLEPPCFIETFENIPASNSSYLSRNWTGDEGIDISASDASTNQTINSRAILIRNGSLTINNIPNGISEITLTTQRQFSGGSGNLDVLVNNISVGSIPYDATVQTSTISNIDVAGTYNLEIATPSNGDRIKIDDLIIFCFIPTPTITLSSPSQVSSDNAALGASNVILSHFQAAITDADATLNALAFTTTGTYQAADLDGNFKLFYSSSSTFGSATSVGTVAVGNPGTFTFSGLSETIADGNTGYFWIAVDIDASGTNGRTIQVSANPVLTFADGTPTGTIAAGGTQTLTTAAVVPTVISDPVSNITNNSASSGGDVTSDGNAAVTARGIVFGTSPSPTGNATSNGSGTGTFSSTASGLNPQTLYYLRAYATNSEGTAYGADKDFRTLSNPPSVQAASLTVANTSTNSIELSIGSAATFPGSGATEAGYVVIYNEGSAPVLSANNGEAPAASTGSIFTTAATTLPASPATSITVTGLNGDATYHFLVIPYTWDGSNAATYHYLTASAPTVTGTTNAGWSINAANTRFRIDFDQTVAGVNNGQFNGSGFAGNPSSGQLNSNAWASTGMSDGAGAFNGAHNSGDFARGNSNGGAGTGGFYAFEVATGNRAFGVQPVSSDFAPGSITLKVQNNTGAAVSSIALAYLIYEYNDQGRSSNFNFSYSTDDINYTDLSDLNFISEEAAAGSPAWKAFYRRSNIASLNIAHGDFLYLRWSSDDVGGGGSRDELALDDIEVVFNPGDANPLIEGSIAGGIMQGNTTLSDDLSVAQSLSILSGKVFTTNSHKIILQPSATLTESGNNTIRGTIEIETATTQNTNNTFGNIGIVINPKDNPMGTTKVTRITGERLQGGPSPSEENASLLRYFQVEPTTNTDLNATVEFFYADDELVDESDNPINVNDLALFKRDIGAANDQWVLLAGSVDGINKKITTDNIQTFSEIALGDANNPLPIDLLFFNAIKKDQSVQLNWATAAEINNSHFEIEKSLDAKNFDVIGSVNGAGNSSKVLSYQFTDLQVCEICYYRLKQIDFDGKSSYSNVVMIKNELRQDDYVNAYKANNHLVIKSFFTENHLNQTVNIDIFNRIGQLVYTEVVPGQEVNIIQPNLPLSGIYILRLDYGHQVVVKRIFW